MFELSPMLIPILALSIPIFAIWTKHQQKIAEIQARNAISTTATDKAEHGAQSAAKLQALEERVRVLERIVTDGGYNTAAQIEALRDTRTVEGSSVPIHLVSKERA